MILAVTGHRPNRLGGYGQDVLTKAYNCARVELIKHEPEIVITGMALGWDTAVAIVCRELDIPYWAFVPFKGQESVWSETDQALYRSLIDSAQKLYVVSEGGYAAVKMHVRNMEMVDRSDQLLALWNGSTNGGTFRCVNYARTKGKVIHNCWDHFCAL